MLPTKHEILGKPICVEPAFMESAYTKDWPEGIRVEARKTQGTDLGDLAIKIRERCIADDWVAEVNRGQGRDGGGFLFSAKT